jgi:hypothetical protein
VQADPEEKKGRCLYCGWHLVGIESGSRGTWPYPYRGTLKDDGRGRSAGCWCLLLVVQRLRSESRKELCVPLVVAGGACSLRVVLL